MNEGTKLESSARQLTTPHFENSAAMLLAGLSRHYAGDMMKRISEQWKQFGRHIGRVAGQVGRAAFGGWYKMQEKPFGMDHICAVEVSSAKNLPAEFTTLQLSPHRYAIFSHPGHLSVISRTVDAIFHSWLSTSGHAHDSESNDKLAFFERYGENFDPGSGTGDIEIWVPIKA